MAGIFVYNGSAFAPVTPHLSETAGTFSNPVAVSVYNGSSWIKVWPTLTFSPNPGTYSRSSTYPNAVGFTISASQAVIWTYSHTGDAPTFSVSSGQSSTSINMSLQPSQTVDKSCTINLLANGTYSWTINFQTFGLA